MDNLWPKPEGDLQAFQREYFLSYGASLFAKNLIAELQSSEERMRDIQQRIEREKLKNVKPTTTRPSR